MCVCSRSHRKSVLNIYINLGGDYPRRVIYWNGKTIFEKREMSVVFYVAGWRGWESSYFKPVILGSWDMEILDINRYTGR